MEVATRFGENLRRLREGAGISQEELGLRCSLHRTEIGLLERGARVPRIDTLIKIASGLSVRIDCKLLAGRAGQTETVDAVKLVHEARDELEERARRYEDS